MVRRYEWVPTDGSHSTCPSRVGRTPSWRRSSMGRAAPSRPLRSRPEPPNRPSKPPRLSRRRRWRRCGRCSGRPRGRRLCRADRLRHGISQGGECLRQYFAVAGSSRVLQIRWDVLMGAALRTRGRATKYNDPSPFARRRYSDGRRLTCDAVKWTGSAVIRSVAGGPERDVAGTRWARGVAGDHRVAHHRSAREPCCQHRSRRSRFGRRRR
jgi:hypothetical protein